MKWPVLVIRTLLGLGFVLGGLMYFGKFMENQPFPNETAEIYLTKIMIPTGYMNIVKVLELVGGLMLLSGFFVPLGLTILTPIIVNILIYEVCILRQPGPGAIMTALAVFLIAGYWQHFKPVFARKATIGL